MNSSRHHDATWLCEPEWLRQFLISEKRPNVLITCATDVVQSVVTRVVNMSPHPVHARLLPSELCLPQSGTGVLLLWDVSRMKLGQQIELHDWLTYRRRETQVISVTSVPLLPLVEEGQFLEGLFYRLNAVSLSIRVPSFSSDSPVVDAGLLGQPDSFRPMRQEPASEPQQLYATLGRQNAGSSEPSRAPRPKLLDHGWRQHERN